VSGRAACRAVLEAHAWPGGPGRAGTGPLNSVPSCGWAGPKTHAFRRATGSRAFWTSKHSSRAGASRHPPSPLAPGSHAACAFRRVRRARAQVRKPIHPGNPTAADRSPAGRRSARARRTTPPTSISPPLPAGLDYTCRPVPARDRLAAASHRDPRPHA
jgi:hypothetical protein